jgi:hypothetical protein
MRGLDPRIVGELYRCVPVNDIGVGGYDHGEEGKTQI